MPAYFNKATGKRVTVDEATHDGKRLRDGYNWMLEEGESARFSLDMIDGAASGRRSVFLTDNTEIAPKSIDAALKAEFEKRAKQANLSHAEYLKSTTPDQVEEMIRTVASEIVKAGVAEGVAASLNFDQASFAVRALIDNERRALNNDAAVECKVAEMRASHRRKFGFMGDSAPTFDERNAAMVARSKIETDNAAVRNAIRDAHYQ